MVKPVHINMYYFINTIGSEHILTLIHFILAFL